MVQYPRDKFYVAKWGVFCHSAWLQISPARFKQVYSDKAGRTHDRNLQTSETLKLTFAQKEPSTHESTPQRSGNQQIGVSFVTTI